MLGHYLAVAALAFRKSPFVALANSTVLALGLTAFVATYAITDFWNGAERQFENADRIFVIASRIEANDGSVVLDKVPATNPYIANYLPTYVPRIEAVARARNLGFGGEVPVSAGDRAAPLFAVAADAEFLEIFTCLSSPAIPARRSRGRAASY
jgi:hypothetical protein